jgi:hypothetical protein
MRILSRAFGIAALTAASISCGDVARTGTSPVLLVINQLTASPGGGPRASQSSGFLLSDVITNVFSPAPCSPTSPCPTIFNDTASVQLSLQAKNPGVAPSTLNAVTIDRVHIEYVRADGRNTPGIDVPYPFDGAMTGTVTASGSPPLGFEIVRHVAKQESPLVQLITSPNVITTIARVTFYGHDQAGNQISVTGQIQIDFGNFGDS